jgi:hypothetical protein
MSTLERILYSIIIACLVASSAAAQTARQVHRAAAVVPLQNEPPAKDRHGSVSGPSPIALRSGDSVPHRESAHRTGVGSYRAFGFGVSSGRTRSRDRTNPHACLKPFAMNVRVSA